MARLCTVSNLTTPACNAPNRIISPITLGGRGNPVKAIKISPKNTHPKIIKNAFKIMTVLSDPKIPKMTYCTKLYGILHRLI
ncbi:hypothetical protein [Moraxella lacunata]|uniref:hypothetical protein n=1 Tax=Moraxella lacunata TaxID=477 RepID=UPI003EE39771